MFQRTNAYHQFIADYPGAQFIAMKYNQGLAGEVAIGEQGNTAVALFAGVYKSDGGLIGERVITDADLASPRTVQGHDKFHAFKLAAELCDEIAGVPRIS